MNDLPKADSADIHTRLLNESETITRVHYKILAMSWAG